MVSLVIDLFEYGHRLLLRFSLTFFIDFLDMICVSVPNPAASGIGFLLFNSLSQT